MEERDDDRRARLEGYIARSQRVKRIALLVGAACAAGGFAMRAAGLPGELVLAAVLLGVMVAGTALWISGGHIRDFRSQLRALDARRGKR